MKCVILGGAGFIGLHLAEALLEAGHAVRLFDRPGLPLPPEISRHGMERQEGDFINQGDLARAVGGCEVVFHLVSTTLPKTSNDNPVYDVETNVLGSLRLLELARAQAVRKIIFVSSGGTVYGVPERVPISETHPTNPIVSYGIGKLAIEKYLHLYHTLHGVDYCVLRLANPYGERQRANASQGAVAVFLHQALKGETIEIWGDGGVTRDYIYIGDVTAAMLKALAHTGEPRLFNVGSGIGLSLNEVLAQIEATLDRPVKRTYLSGRKFDVPISVLDTERIRRVLGWKPAISFPEGLSKTLAWLRKAALT